FFAADGSIIWNKNANSSFKTDIAGIGRDDNQWLNQKQSRSNSIGVQPIISLGNLATNNKANGSNFSSDKMYLLWGHNNQGEGFTNPINNNAPSGFSNLARMSKVWKVQEKNTVPTVQLSVEASTFSDTAWLIVSNDSTFNSGTSWYPLYTRTVNGVQYKVADVNFTSGQYFSFSTGVKAPGGISGLALWVRAD